MDLEGNIENLKSKEQFFEEELHSPRGEYPAVLSSMAVGRAINRYFNVNFRGHLDSVIDGHGHVIKERLEDYKKT